LVVNLYPFEETVEKKSDWEITIENIDGWPRHDQAAAKNHDRVTVIVDLMIIPVLSELSAMAETLRDNTAFTGGQAFARTAAYGSAIASVVSAELEMPRQATLQLAASAFKPCATVKTPIKPLPSTAAPINARVAERQTNSGQRAFHNNINDTDAA
jgi:AICAR transformylase/IMP cyclohydrolase PurH